MADPQVVNVVTMRQALRGRLLSAAHGERPVSLRTIEGLLATHLVELDVLAAATVQATEDVIETTFGNGLDTKVPPSSILEIIERFARIHSSRLADVRRTAELMMWLVAQRPSVSVLDARPVAIEGRQSD